MGATARHVLVAHQPLDAVTAGSAVAVVIAHGVAILSAAASATRLLGRALAAANRALGHNLEVGNTARLVVAVDQPIDSAAARGGVAVVVATGVATMVCWRRHVLATPPLVDATPGLVLHAPTVLPVGPPCLAIVGPLWASPPLVLATPRALVHRPPLLPVRPARVAVENFILAT